jgi:hypothetical protein
MSLDYFISPVPYILRVINLGHHWSPYLIMVLADDKRSRAPRGSRPVTQAFLTALEAVPETSRASVAKAAMVMIRDVLKTSKPTRAPAAAKAKKARAKTGAVRKVRKARAAAKLAAPPEPPAVKKRRGRKPADTSPVA